MTTITIFRDQNKDCIGFEMKGHAGYGVSGNDIVCAAISVLAINTQNSIERFTSDRFAREIDEQEGYMYFMLEKDPGSEAKLLLNSMVLGLTQIEQQFGSSRRCAFQKKYLKLKFKEV
ncbi:MAG: ribosomal-processing cysteine protease Prp [Lachnospiraceae bacterium]|nr:ribosomal-processing cysteine protease Prp [Lachnospiraceae bacterium]